MLAVRALTADDIGLDITFADEAALERFREALGDPIWLLGATWEILTTNDYKRGRFDDAFGAWVANNTADDVTAALDHEGITVSPR